MICSVVCMHGVGARVTVADTNTSTALDSDSVCNDIYKNPVDEPLLRIALSGFFFRKATET